MDFRYAVRMKLHCDVKPMQFPVLLQLSGDDELEFAETPDQLKVLLNQTGPVLPQDRWIDSTGQTYALQNTSTVLEQLGIAELTTLVQTHFFSLSQSCVMKIHAKSIPELIALVRPSAADSD